MKQVLCIGTRGSPLALAQSEGVLKALETAWPKQAFHLEIIKTTGDRWSAAQAQTQSQAQPPAGTAPLPGKGIFIKEIEQALLDGKIDLAVHSLKDLPVEITPGLAFAAIPKREDARDVLICRHPFQEPGLKSIALDAAIATGSLRRRAQLHQARPDLKLVDIRGNIDTRLRKLRENTSWTAIVLAHAGLTRLKPDLSELFCAPLDFGIMLPAPGQGALALQARAGDSEIAHLCSFLHDPATAAAVTAERAFLAGMGGGCAVPLGAHGIPEGHELELDGVYFPKHSTHGTRQIIRGHLSDAQALGQRLAEQVLQRSSESAAS